VKRISKGDQHAELWETCTQYGPLETHAVTKVFHVDNGMFIGDSTGRRNARRTSHAERVKGHHDGGQFSDARQHVTDATAGELIDCIVQFANYRGKIQQLRLMCSTDVYRHYENSLLM